MSNPPVWKRHRDLAGALVLTGVGAVLAALDILSISGISMGLAAAIFTVVISASMTLLAVLEAYGKVISKAKEQNLLGTIQAVFRWPILVSVIGFIIGILATVFRWNIEAIQSFRFIFNLQEWLTLLITGLLIYTILAFSEAFWFVFRVVAAEPPSENDDEEENDEADQKSEDIPQTAS